MKAKNILLTTLLGAALTASAIPARKGAVYQLQQPDGTTVNLEIVGDEFAHYYLTTDRKVVIAQNNEYCYASVDENDMLVNTRVLAHDPHMRSQEEAILASSIDPQPVINRIVNRNEGMSRANSQDGKGKMTTTNFPTTGVVKSLAILVSYADVDFEIEDPHTYFTGLLNEEGFSENGCQGSCRDYYIDASNGQFLPHFDVLGPVKLPNERAYYGANNSQGNDVRPEQMMLHAGQLLDEEVDFSEYDLDGDGFVDNVHIFYAGMSEVEGGGADSVWPHQWNVGMNNSYRFDGVYLSRYACGSELASHEPVGIGTFCHEFAHVLGLPDLYNTVDASANYTPLYYSLMDQGNYNGDGKLPPTLSAYERNALGWMGDDLIEITGPMECELEHILTSNKAYLINTDRANEYFLFENRQQEGWDKELPGHGMLVWHIDYNRTMFNNNTPNNTERHQRVDIVEANGRTGLSMSLLKRYPFPGTTKKTEFVFGGTPSFETWNGKDLELPITDITETDGVIRFKVAGGSGINDAIINANTRYDIDGRNINVTSDGMICISDITGRVLATGQNAVAATAGAPGLYLITTAEGTHKVAIR